MFAIKCAQGLFFFLCSKSGGSSYVHRSPEPDCESKGSTICQRPANDCRCRLCQVTALGKFFSHVAVMCKFAMVGALSYSFGRRATCHVGLFLRVHGCSSSPGKGGRACDVASVVCRLCASASWLTLSRACYPPS